MKTIAIICTLFTFVCCTNTKKQQKLTPIDLKSEIFDPLKYIVPKSTEAIIIDGLNNEAQWKSAPFTQSFIDIEGVKIPTYNTQAQML